jgi:transcriptional regulator with GAF, ATPase, and Fis domain
MMIVPELYSVPKVCQALQISRTTLWKLETRCFTSDCANPPIQGPPSQRSRLLFQRESKLLEFERQSIIEARQMSRGKIYGPNGAAELLGMRPTTLSSKIAALGIKRN